MQATTGNTLRLLVMCKSVQQFLISMQGVGSCICSLAKNLGSDAVTCLQCNMNRYVAVETISSAAEVETLSEVRLKALPV